MTLFISSIVGASSSNTGLANVATDLPIAPLPEQGLEAEKVEEAIHELATEKQPVVLTEEKW